MGGGVRFFVRNGVNYKLRDDLTLFDDHCESLFIEIEKSIFESGRDLLPALQWRHNERDVVSNHQRLCCLLDRLFRRRSKKPSKLRVTGLCVRGTHRWPVNSPHKGSVTRTKIPFDDVIMANWRSRSVTVSFTCARNVVFQRKINFCVDVERIVYFPYVWLCFICFLFKITHIHIRFVCVYFEFTLLSSTWWTQNGFKSARREDENLLDTH